MQTIINFLVFGGLLVSGATPEPGDELIGAVINRDRALVSRLLEAGANVNHVDNNGISALMIAAGNGQEEMVETLIRKGASVNQLTVIDFACPRTPLLEATRKKQTEVVRLLLRNGANVNQSAPESSYSALHIAALLGDENGDSEIVSILLENNANVNLLSSLHELNSPLYAAAGRSNAQIVSKLIRAGADVNLKSNAHGETALMAASSSPAFAIGGTNRPPCLNRRQMETISLLIQARANINAASHNGFTALLGAVWYSGVDQVSFLIANGANVNQVTEWGTPLMRASEVRSLKKGRLLILAGAETRNLPEHLFQEFIHPIMSSLGELVTHHSSLITMAFVELKNSERKVNMFKNTAFRDSFHEWDDLRIDMVSRIIYSLVNLEPEEMFFTYILSPFLAKADIERLNRFGLVLSFLTGPFATITNASHGSDQPELVRFIKATFRYAIVMGSAKESLDSIVDSMYAVYSHLKSEMGALNQAMRVIPDVHVGTVLQFRHGEFGIYSKFAENLKQQLIRDLVDGGSFTSLLFC